MTRSLLLCDHAFHEPWFACIFRSQIGALKLPAQDTCKAFRSKIRRFVIKTLAEVCNEATPCVSHTQPRAAPARDVHARISVHSVQRAGLSPCNSKRGRLYHSMSRSLCHDLFGYACSRSRRPPYHFKSAWRRAASVIFTISAHELSIMADPQLHRCLEIVFASTEARVAAYKVSLPFFSTDQWCKLLCDESQASCIHRSKSVFQGLLPGFSSTNASKSLFAPLLLSAFCLPPSVNCEHMCGMTCSPRQGACDLLDG